MSDGFAQYQQFIQDLEETDLIWTVANEEGWASCESNDFAEREVILFWSREALAKAVCIDEWAEFAPEPIKVEELLDELLPSMHDDGVLVGVNWNAELEGAEQDPLILLDDILDEDD